MWHNLCGSVGQRLGSSRMHTFLHSCYSESSKIAAGKESVRHCSSHYSILWIFVNNGMSLVHKCAYLVFSFLLLFYLSFSSLFIIRQVSPRSEQWVVFFCFSFFCFLNVCCHLFGRQWIACEIVVWCCEWFHLLGCQVIHRQWERDANADAANAADAAAILRWSIFSSNNFSDTVHRYTWFI